MKATIELDDHLYRRLKVEAARRGRTIRELVDEGVRHVLGLRPLNTEGPDSGDGDWFASLREYAANAGGDHDLDAIQRSVAKKRSRRT